MPLDAAMWAKAQELRASDPELDAAMRSMESRMQPQEEMGGVGDLLTLGAAGLSMLDKPRQLLQAGSMWLQGDKVTPEQERMAGAPFGIMAPLMRGIGLLPSARPGMPEQDKPSLSFQGFAPFGSFLQDKQGKPVDPMQVFRREFANPQWTDRSGSLIPEGVGLPLVWDVASALADPMQLIPFGGEAKVVANTFRDSEIAARDAALGVGPVAREVKPAEAAIERVMGPIGDMENTLRQEIPAEVRSMGPVPESPALAMERTDEFLTKRMGQAPIEPDLGLGMNPNRVPEQAAPVLTLPKIQAGIRKSLATEATELTGHAGTEAMTAVHEAKAAESAAAEMDQLQEIAQRAVSRVAGGDRDQAFADALSVGSQAAEQAKAKGLTGPDWQRYVGSSVNRGVNDFLMKMNPPAAPKTIELGQIAEAAGKTETPIASMVKAEQVTEASRVVEQFPRLKRLAELGADRNAIRTMAKEENVSYEAMRVRIRGDQEAARKLMPEPAMESKVGDVVAGEKKIRLATMPEFSHAGAVEVLPEGGVKLTARNGAQAILKRQEMTPGVAGRYIGVWKDGKLTGQIDVDALRGGQETLSHEMVHWARELGLFHDDEWGRLATKFQGLSKGRGIEEDIAVGLARARFAERGTIQKIREFIAGLYEAVTGKRTGTGAIQRWRTGQTWEGKANPRAPIRGVVQSEARYSLVDDLPSSLKAGLESKHVESAVPEGMITGAINRVMNAAKTARQEGVAKAWDKYLAPIVTSSTGNIEKQAFMPIMDRLIRQGVLKADQLYKDAGTTLRNLPGMLARFGSIIEGKAALKVGNEVIMARTNLLNKFRNPVENFLLGRYGSKANIPAGEADSVFALADQYLVARRAVGEASALRQTGGEWLQEVQKASAAGLPDPAIPPTLKTKLEKVGWDGKVETLDAAIGKWEAGMTGAAKAAGKDFEVLGDVAFHQQQLADIEKSGYGKVVKGVAKAVDEIAAVAMKYARKKGLLTADEYAAAQAKGDYYSPLKRVFGDEEFIGPNRGQAGGVLKYFEGSERAIKNPASSVFDQLNMVIGRADRNEVWQVAVGDIHKMMEEAKVARLEKDFDRADMLDRMVKEHAEDVERVADAANGDPAVRKVFLNGEATFWRFKDQLAIEQMSALDKYDNVGAIEKVLKVPGILLRRSLSLSPRYSVFNFIRDSFARVIGSRHGGGLFDAFHRWTPDEWSTFIESGALQGSRLTDVEQAYKLEMLSHMKDLRGTPGTILARADNAASVIGDMFGRLERLTTNLELQNRMAEFQNAFKHAKQTWPTASDEALLAYAAKSSRDLLDFSEAGTAIKRINTFVPFVNASVQGSRFILKAAARNPAQFTYKIGKYIAAPSLGCYGLAMASGRGKEYQNLPAYRRDYFWNFALPGGYWLTIPKSFEAGVLGTGVERLVDLAGGNKRAFEGYFGSVKMGLVPVDESALLGPLRPIVEALTNRDMFRGSNIVPAFEEGLALPLRAGAAKASRLGKTLTWLFNGVSGYESDPRQFDHVISGLFGDYGRLMTSPNEVSTLTRLTGFVRKDSPYTYLSVQRTLGQYQRLGLERSTERRKLTDLLKKAGEGQATLAQVFTAAERESTRLSKITIADILGKRKKKP